MSKIFDAWLFSQIFPFFDSLASDNEALSAVLAILEKLKMSNDRGSRLGSTDWPFKGV